MDTQHSHIAAIVLAAGLSTRMGGQPKPLLPFGEQTVIQRILGVLDECTVPEIVVVSGHHHHALDRALTGMPVKCVFNPSYANGEMLSSLQIGLGAISAHASAALVLLGDQPALEANVVQSVIAAHHAGLGSVVIPSYQMRRGHPLLIAHQHWSALLDLRVGQTLRDFMRAVNKEIYHVAVDTPSILRDMDTPEEYQRELAAYRQKQLAFAPAE